MLWNHQVDLDLASHENDSQAESLTNAQREADQYHAECNEARTRLLELERQVIGAAEEGYHRGRNETVAEYNQRFLDQLPEMKDQIFSSYWKPALDFCDIPDDSPLWSMDPLPSRFEVGESSAMGAVGGVVSKAPKPIIEEAQDMDEDEEILRASEGL